MSEEVEVGVQRGSGERAGTLGGYTVGGGGGGGGGEEYGHGGGGSGGGGGAGTVNVAAAPRGGPRWGLSAVNHPRRGLNI